MKNSCNTTIDTKYNFNQYEILKKSHILFIVNNNGLYIEKKISSISSICDEINESICLQNTKVYLINKKFKIDIILFKKKINKKYQQLFDELNSNKFIDSLLWQIKYTILFLTLFLTFSYIYVIFEWIKIGLPYESIADKSLIYNFITSVFLMLIESAKDIKNNDFIPNSNVLVSAFVLIFIYSSLFVIPFKLIQSKLPKKIMSYPFFYIKIFLLVSHFSFISVIIILTYSVFIESKFNLFNMYLKNSIYPKIIVNDKNLTKIDKIISHQSGKYFYISDINISKNNCTSKIDFIKSMHIRADEFNPVEYNNIDLTKFKTFSEICK